MRVIFMGTPDFSVPTLKALIEHPFFDVCAVYTRAPTPKNRGHQVQKTPIHLLADIYNIPVHTPKTLRCAQEQSIFSNYKADVAVVVAYGLILPCEILEAPKQGCVNIHGSLLPRWRGAAPIHRALMAGDTKTGITTMQMDVGLDTGPMMMMQSMDILPSDTTRTLHDQLSLMGADLLLRTLLSYASITPQIQSEKGVTYAHKITKEEGLLDFSKPADVLERQVRALSPWPGSFFEHKGNILKVHQTHVPNGMLEPGVMHMTDQIWHIGCGDKRILALDMLQKEGSKPLPVDIFLNGYRF